MRTVAVPAGRVGEASDVVHRDTVVGFADLAAARQEPGGQHFVADGARHQAAVLATSLLRRSGIPPNRATSGFLPLRSILASKHLCGPCTVAVGLPLPGVRKVDG